MMAESLGNVVNSMVDQMQIAYEHLQGGEGPEKDKSDFSLENFWHKLNAAAKLVSHEITKLCLVFSKPPLPDVQQTHSLLKSLEATYLTVLDTFYGLPKERGLTLRKEVHKAVLQLLGSLITVVKSLKDKGEKGKQHRLQLTGHVWEAGEIIENLPKDNLQATINILQREEALVQDALQEIDDEMNEDEERVQEVDNSETWTNQDREMLPSCVGVIKTGRSCLRKAISALHKNGRCETEEEVTQLDDLTTAAQGISPAVDDFLSAVYPPMERSNVKSCALVLVQRIELLLNTIKQSHYVKEDDSSWIRFLLKAVRHNNNKLQPLLEP